MKALTVLFLGIILFFITSCGDPVAPIHETIVEKLSPIILTDEDLFSGIKVLSFLQNEEKHVKESNSLFLKGVDAFRNKENLDSADFYFRSSLLKEPSAQTYFELGNLCMTEKKYDDALLSFNMAEQLNYEPFSKLLYNKSCIYSLQEKIEQSAQYLEYSIQAGYSNIDYLYKDSDLENLRDSWRFENVVKKGLRGVSNSENIFWLQFKKQFPKVKFPLQLNNYKSYAELDELNKQISYDYENYISEMRDEKFSREVGKIFYYHSNPYETKKYVVLVYIIRDDFMSESFPILYRMATFNHEGKLIDKKVIAGQENMDDSIIESEVVEDGVKMIFYHTVYEKDTEEYGYAENPIIKRTKQREVLLTITEDGHFVENEIDLVSELD